MKYLKKIIRVIIATIIILIISLNIYNFINIKILNKDLSTIFGYATLEVVSGSMEPTIEVGELIVIDTNETNYKANDIVTFYDINGAFVTHRIIAINEDKMITKGDNNHSMDGIIDTDKIVGKYVCKIPYLGAVLTVIQKPLILLLILIIGILYSYLISTEQPKEKITKKPKEKSKRQKKKEHKQFLKQQKRQKKQEKKQEKQDYLEFKQFKKQQIKEQERREFIEFRKMKEAERRNQEELKKKIQQTDKNLIEDKNASIKEVRKDTNLTKQPTRNKHYKPNQNRKKQKNYNKNNYNKHQNKKHKSNKNYNYNKKKQNYKKRK